MSLPEPENQSNPLNSEPENQENHQFLQSPSETLRLQDLYLELLMLTPIFLIFFFLYTSKSTFIALLLYQFLLAIGPPIYLKYLIKTPIKPFYWNFFTYQWKQQLFYGIPLCFLVFSLSFTLIQSLLQSMYLYLITYKFLLNDNMAVYITIFLLLTFTTPVLSMIYWIAVPLDTEKEPKTLRICFYYGLFHGLIVNIFKNSLSGLIFMLAYMILAYGLVLLKKRFGVITGILTLIGFGLSYSLGLVLIIKEQKRFFE